MGLYQSCVVPIHPTDGAKSYVVWCKYIQPPTINLGCSVKIHPTADAESKFFAENKSIIQGTLVQKLHPAMTLNLSCYFAYITLEYRPLMNVVPIYSFSAR